MRLTNVFDFEELNEDLPRPPLAALRLFAHAGVNVTLRGWSSVSKDERLAMAAEGSRDRISDAVSQALIGRIAVRELKLVAKATTFEDKPLQGLEVQLNLTGPIEQDVWLRLSALDRFALNYLRHNTRLVRRAFLEITERTHIPMQQRTERWRGLVGQAVLQLTAEASVRKDLVNLLFYEKLLQGKGLILARVAGVRAARHIHDLFDLQSTTLVGAVELIWVVRSAEAQILWQAHASTWDGHFSSSASLLACITAATALFDMIKEFDPNAHLCQAAVMESEWMAQPVQDEVTMFYRRPS